MRTTARTGALALALVLAVVALVGVAGLPAHGQTSGVVIGQPEIELSTPAGEFDAGTRALLPVVVSNEGEIRRGGPAAYQDRVTAARGLSLTPRDGGVPVAIENETVALGTVPGGTAPRVPLALTVPDDTEPGTYRLPIEVSYRYTASVEYGRGAPEYNDVERSVTRDVRVRVRDGPRFEVIDVSSDAQIGDEATVRVTLANDGSETARDARVRLSSESDEVTFGSRSASSTAYVGQWGADERRTVNYTVAIRSDAAQRGYALGATVVYEDGDGVPRRSTPLTVGIQPRREQTFALRNVSSSLRVGSDGEVAATVVNEGPERARSPVVRLRTANPNVDVDTSGYALRDLAPGERERVRFDVSVTEGGSPSQQQLNVSVVYRNARGDRRASDPLEARVRIAPKRDRFVVEAADGPVRAGRSGAYRLRVRNNREERLRNVELKAFLQQPLSSADDEAVVGVLAPGASKVFVIDLAVDGSALSKSYPVTVDLQYETPDGDTELSRTYTVPVRVERGPSGGLPLVPGVLVVAAVAAIGAIVWRRRG